MSAGDREIQIGLTARQAAFVASVLRQAKRRLERRIEKSGFVPAPGRFDANRSRITIIDDVLAQMGRLPEGDA